MNLKKCKPIFIENSKVPAILSKIAPINIWAISFGIWVWCKGTLSETTKRHETIHFQQQIELLFVFQWILYGLYYVKNYIIYKDGPTAYRESPFEREAYQNEDDEDYLKTRERYAWLKYR